MNKLIIIALLCMGSFIYGDQASYSMVKALSEDQLSQLINEKSDILFKSDSSGRTLLWYTVVDENIDLFRKLIDSGVDPLLDTYLYPPLFDLLVYADHDDFISIGFQLGLDIEYKKRYEGTILSDMTISQLSMDKYRRLLKFDFDENEIKSSLVSLILGRKYAYVLPILEKIDNTYIDYLRETIQKYNYIIRSTSTARSLKEYDELLSILSKKYGLNFEFL